MPNAKSKDGLIFYAIQNIILFADVGVSIPMQFLRKPIGLS